MQRFDAIVLLGEVPEAHGVYDAPTPTQRTVFVTVDGVGMTELYTAMAQGLRPEIKFHLELAEDYCGEKRLDYHGETYTIIRTQLDRDGGDGLTIVAQRGVQHGSISPGSNEDGA
ncbi:MAG: hypothetical protein J6S60_04855 [Oscillospiraceae bacterium]|nr:hypothetical protein [Oscillospiraceae bacterium]